MAKSTAKPKKSLEEIVKERFEDDELCAALVKDADEHGTRKAIESGKCGLPDVDSAKRWHEKKKQEASEDEE